MLVSGACLDRIGGNISAIFAGTITPRKYSLRIVHHVILVTLNLAFAGPFYRSSCYYQAVLGDDLPDPKGPLTTPSPRHDQYQYQSNIHVTVSQ